MNSYSFASDSHRWWWLPAAAGALGTAAVTAILVVPATGSSPTEFAPAGGVGATGAVTVVDRPCYLARQGWNTVAGWEQPVCTTVIDARPGLRTTGGRGVPDFLP